MARKLGTLAALMESIPERSEASSLLLCWRLLLQTIRQYSSIQCSISRMMRWAGVPTAGTRVIVMAFAVHGSLAWLVWTGLVAKHHHVRMPSLGSSNTRYLDLCCGCIVCVSLANVRRVNTSSQHCSCLGHFMSRRWACRSMSER